MLNKSSTPAITYTIEVDGSGFQSGNTLSPETISNACKKYISGHGEDCSEYMFRLKDVLDRLFADRRMKQALIEMAAMTPDFSYIWVDIRLPQMTAKIKTIDNKIREFFWFYVDLRNETVSPFAAARQYYLKQLYKTGIGKYEEYDRVQLDINCGHLDDTRIIISK